MDTIGLLAAWVGVISFLIATVTVVATSLISSPFERWWATTSLRRMEQRIEKLNSDLGLSQAPGNGQIFDLVCLYGSMTLHLVAGVAIVLVSIQILDLGPALLAATLPFNIDSKLLTRGTGIFLFLSSYFFVFRLSYLASRVRAKTLPRSPMFQEKAQAEIDNLRHRLAATTTQVTRAGAKMTPEEAKLR